jgi:hypothetical protein
MSHEEKVLPCHSHTLDSHQILRVRTRFVEILVHVLHGETDNDNTGRSSYAMIRSIDLWLNSFLIETI